MDLRNATKQQVFDHVVRHLINQGAPAVTHHGACKYRMPNGTSCAVGCLIPEDRYDPRMEGITIEDLATRYPHLGIRSDLVPLLRDLQEVHDDWSFYGHLDENTGLWRLRDAFCRVARRNFLSQLAVFDSIHSLATSMPAATKELELTHAH